MTTAVLLDLLRHHDEDVQRQAVELAASLADAERLSLSAALLGEPWRHGRPWLALRLCAPGPDAADAALRRWHLRCGDAAIRLLPDTPSWRALLAALERNARAPCPQRLREACRDAQADLSRQRLREATCGRAALVAAEEAAEADRRGGWMAPWLLRRFAASGEEAWAEEALLELCAGLLGPHSTSRR